LAAAISVGAIAGDGRTLFDSCVNSMTATWVGYDLFALRTIGANHVPYRIAALASFSSYAIGHNIGATA
jgi:hypothetical protein